MPHIDPGWRPALVLAAVLALAALLLRRYRRVGPGFREASVVAVLYAGWCLVGRATHPHYAGAEGRGRDINTFERWLHVPNELTVQRFVLPHPWLAHAVDAYYLFGHINLMGVVLAWTFFRHRDGYPALRLQLILLTVIGEAMQTLAVAPPRLLPDLGFVDLANKYGESVYGTFGGGLPGQLLAMPSLHVGWAALVAWTVWKNANGRWRWLGIGHLVIMVLVVVAGGNHWWADGAVAIAVLAVIIVAVDRLPRLPRLLHRTAPVVVPARVPVEA